MWYCYPHKKGPHEKKVEDFEEAWEWLKSQTNDNAYIITFSDRTKYFKWETVEPVEEEETCCGHMCTLQEG